MKFNRRYSFLFAITLFFPVLVMCQGHSIDSLQNLLKTEGNDTNRVNTLNALCTQYSNIGNYHKADSLVKQSLQMAGTLNFKMGLATAYRAQGALYEDEGDYPEALEAQKKALELAEETGDKKTMGYAYVYIGNIYEDEGNYPEALKSQLQSLKICQEIGDKEGIGSAYTNIGNIYSDQGNYEEAVKNQQLALALFQKIGDKDGIASTYSNIGNAYTFSGKYTEALKNQLEGLKMFEKIGEAPNVAYAYGNLGTIYQKMGNYQEALKNVLKSTEMSREIGDQYGLGSAYVAVGSVYTKLKDYNKAGKYLDSAMVLNKSIGEKDAVRDTYRSLVEYDSATGDYNKCFSDYKEYILYRDSLKNKDFDKKILRQQMNFDFQHKEDSAKAQQDKKDALAAAETKKQKVITSSVVLGLILVLAFAMFAFRSWRITRKQKEVIESKSKETEEQKRAVEERNNIIESKNKEVLDSITYAKRLQDAILPPISIIKKHLPESFVLYKPKDIVAGDFYWFERTGDNILIAACDCTGHGVPGAMVSVVCSNALNRAVKEFRITEPGKILDKVRELVMETFEKSESEVKDGMDASLCSINTSTGEIHWSGAYNPLWYIKNGELKEEVADKQPIGVFDIQVPFNTSMVKLSKGDSLYLFTDGYADQFGGPKGKKFKYKQMQELLLANISKPMTEQGGILNEAINAWKGNLEQIDDILVIGIRV